jgi:hypothetical protein
MTVWLLVWTTIGSHQSFTVPNIATERECQRLGSQLSKKVNATFECIQYEVATVDSRR